MFRTPPAPEDEAGSSRERIAGPGPLRDAEPETPRTCGAAGVRELLEQAQLKPTRQRLRLGELLFGRGGRHVTPDMLYREVNEGGEAISRGTVYNTLHELTRAGLVRQIGVRGGVTFFDTNPSTHHHYFIDGEDRLLDLDGPGLDIAAMPELPAGYEVARIDAIVHLRRKRS
jgi:Fur family iron response transcriptional regulator